MIFEVFTVLLTPTAIAYTLLSKEGGDVTICYRLEIICNTTYLNQSTKKIVTFYTKKCLQTLDTFTSIENRKHSFQSPRIC